MKVTFIPDPIELKLDRDFHSKSMSWLDELYENDKEEEYWKR